MSYKYSRIDDKIPRLISCEIITMVLLGDYIYFFNDIFAIIVIHILSAFIINIVMFINL